MKFKNLKNEFGFTLVELLLVIAIIGILSGVILVGMSSYRDDADKTKVMSELGGALGKITMCYSDDGTVNSPGNGTSLCTLDASYGNWPNLLDTGWSYGGNNFSSSNSANWYLEVNRGGDKICCNSKSAKCGEFSASCGENSVIK